MLLKKCIFLFVLIFTQVVFSQEKNDEGSDLSIIVANSETAYVMSNSSGAAIDKEKGPPEKEKPLSRDGILIEQIGDFNFVYTDLKAKTIKVEVIQQGDFNFYELVKASNTISVKALQKGEQNFTSNISLYSGYDTYVETVQQGTNLNIQSLGSNSISSNMKIIQSGADASVIVINN